MAISILIVDDHEMIRRLLRRHLEAEDDFVVVGEAENGREGIAKAEALYPDVILMDVAMPEMDGLETTRVIRERLPQVKILMLTLYTSSENSTRAMQSGAHGYVLKESINDEIVTAIRTVANGEHFWGAGVPNPE